VADLTSPFDLTGQVAIVVDAMARTVDHVGRIDTGIEASPCPADRATGGG